MCVRLSVRACSVRVCNMKNAVLCVTPVCAERGKRKRQRTACWAKERGSDETALIPPVRKQSSRYCTSTMCTRFIAHLRGRHVVRVRRCGERSKSQTDSSTTV